MIIIVIVALDALQTRSWLCVGLRHKTRLFLAVPRPVRKTSQARTAKAPRL